MDVKRIAKKIIKKSAKFINSETIDKNISIGGKISVPIFGKIEYIHKNNYDNGESSYNLKIDYDDEKMRKSIRKEIEKIVLKKLPKGVPSSIIKEGGGSQLIGFTNSFTDKYIW